MKEENEEKIIREAFEERRRGIAIRRLARGGEERDKNRKCCLQAGLKTCIVRKNIETAIIYRLK
jgi:hypothetical protein